MSIAATSAIAAAPEPSWSRELGSPLGMPSARNLPAKPTPAEVKKAAGQFEAIILRQLLGPSIEPMMSGGLGGSGSSSGGGGGSVYGYMLTDTLCSSLGSSGGLGIARMLEKQLAPPATAAAAATEDVSSPSK